MLRDIIEAHPDANINILAFNLFVSELLSRVGCPVAVKRIMGRISERGIGCGINSLYQYLEFMREAFMLETVEFFSPSAKVRNRNYRKLYCIDWALADAVAPGRGIDITRQFENMVYIELRRRNYRVSYFRTRNGYEVDFVAVSSSNGSISLIQVAWSVESQDVLTREVRALVGSAKYLKAEEVIIITSDDERIINYDGLIVRVVPAWKWLLEEI